MAVPTTSPITQSQALRASGIASQQAVAQVVIAQQAQARQQQQQQEQQRQAQLQAQKAQEEYQKQLEESNRVQRENAEWQEAYKLARSGARFEGTPSLRAKVNELRAGGVPQYSEAPKIQPEVLDKFKVSVQPTEPLKDKTGSPFVAKESVKDYMNRLAAESKQKIKISPLIEESQKLAEQQKAKLFGGIGTVYQTSTSRGTTMLTTQPTGLDVSFFQQPSITTEQYNVKIGGVNTLLSKGAYTDYLAGKGLFSRLPAKDEIERQIEIAKTQVEKKGVASKAFEDIAKKLSTTKEKTPYGTAISRFTNIGLQLKEEKRIGKPTEEQVLQRDIYNKIIPEQIAYEQKVKSFSDKVYSDKDKSINNYYIQVRAGYPETAKSQAEADKWTKEIKDKVQSYANKEYKSGFNLVNKFADRSAESLSSLQQERAKEVLEKIKTEYHPIETKVTKVVQKFLKPDTFNPGVYQRQLIENMLKQEEKDKISPIAYLGVPRQTRAESIAKIKTLVGARSFYSGAYESVRTQPLTALKTAGTAFAVGTAGTFFGGPVVGALGAETVSTIGTAAAIGYGVYTGGRILGVQGPYYEKAKKAGEIAALEVIPAAAGVVASKALFPQPRIIGKPNIKSGETTPLKEAPLEVQKTAKIKVDGSTVEEFTGKGEALYQKPATVTYKIETPLTRVKQLYSGTRQFFGGKPLQPSDIYSIKTLEIPATQRIILGKFGTSPSQINPDNLDTAIRLFESKGLSNVEVGSGDRFYVKLPTENGEPALVWGKGIRQVITKFDKPVIKFGFAGQPKYSTRPIYTWESQPYTLQPTQVYGVRGAVISKAPEEALKPLLGPLNFEFYTQTGGVPAIRIFEEQTPLKIFSSPNRAIVVGPKMGEEIIPEIGLKRGGISYVKEGLIKFGTADKVTFEPLLPGEELPFLNKEIVISRGKGLVQTTVIQDPKKGIFTIERGKDISVQMPGRSFQGRVQSVGFQVGKQVFKETPIEKEVQRVPSEDEGPIAKFFKGTAGFEKEKVLLNIKGREITPDNLPTIEISENKINRFPILKEGFKYKTFKIIGPGPELRANLPMPETERLFLFPQVDISSQGNIPSSGIAIGPEVSRIPYINTGLRSYTNIVPRPEPGPMLRGTFSQAITQPISTAFIPTLAMPTVSTINVPSVSTLSSGLFVSSIRTSPIQQRTIRPTFTTLKTSEVSVPEFKTKAFQISSTSQEVKTKSSSVTRTGQILAPILTPIESEILIPIQVPITTQITKTPQEQLQGQLQPQLQKQAQRGKEQIATSIFYPGITINPIQIEIPEFNIPETLSLEEETYKRRKKKKGKARFRGYEVLIKRKGKFVPVKRKFSLPRVEAESFAYQQLLAGPEATAKIVPSMLPVRPSGLKVRPSVRAYFRPGRRAGEIVQKERFRIITPAEKAATSYRGAEAKRRRPAGKPYRKKKKSKRNYKLGPRRYYRF